MYAESREVHDLLYAGARASSDQVGGRTDVRAFQILTLVFSVNARSVDDAAHTGERFEQALGPDEVHTDAAHGIRVPAAALHPAAERNDFHSGVHGGSNDVPADESGSTGDEDFHVRSIIARRRARGRDRVDSERRFWNSGAVRAAGEWPNGKAPDSGSGDWRFEPSLPSHLDRIAQRKDSRIPDVTFSPLRRKHKW